MEPQYLVENLLVLNTVLKLIIIKAINKYTIKLIKYFLLLWLLILFSSISANPIQNTGFTNSIGIKVISIKSSHRAEPFLSIPNPGIIVNVKII